MRPLRLDKTVTIRMDPIEYAGYKKAADQLKLKGGLSQLIRIALSDFVLKTFKRGE